MIMGFISFSLNYYEKELQKLESFVGGERNVYHAKQLLKMLDDLLDEGYTVLNEKLEEKCDGVSRLRNYINKNKATPFPIRCKNLSETDVKYGQNDTELNIAINEFVKNAENSSDTSHNIFLKELFRFCEWIGYEEGTAYIFLLRDTLLPYIFYLNHDRKNIYPWLLGRKTLTTLANKKGVDDEIRASIFKALEENNSRNYKIYCDAVLPDMRNTLKQYPETEKCLIALLSGIKEKHIVVIEAGCAGTFPMLLKSLDDRVDFRMYTTYPYLSEVYRDKIFTQKYEENRLLETLYSQNFFFQFSALADGKFYVKKCQNEKVQKYALAEAKTTLLQI